MQTLQPVNSSMIEALGYNQKDQKLTVKFKNGSTYVYEGIESNTFTTLANAESVGKAFNSEVRGKFSGVKS